MIFWQLFLTFFRIGLFSFGGGYAMIPLLEKEIVTIHGWLPMERLLDLITISQMTPGPIAINMATFVGYHMAGFWGSLIATVGIVMPSAIIIITIATFFLKFQERSDVQGVMNGIRPMTVALIIVAAISVASSALVDSKSIVILALALLATFKLNMHPILLIVLAGILGLFFYK